MTEHLDMGRIGRRRNDRLFARVIRFRWVVGAALSLLLGLLTALGFAVRTPRDNLAVMQARLDSIRLMVTDNRLVADSAIARLDRATELAAKNQLYLRQLVEGSVSVQCLTQPRTITRGAQLPCFRLLNERGLQ